MHIIQPLFMKFIMVYLIDVVQDIVNILKIESLKFAHLQPLCLNTLTSILS